jgi:hypothetical protein
VLDNGVGGAGCEDGSTWVLGRIGSWVLPGVALVLPRTSAGVEIVSTLGTGMLEIVVGGGALEGRVAAVVGGTMRCVDGGPDVSSAVFGAGESGRSSSESLSLLTVSTLLYAFFLQC